MTSRRNYLLFATAALCASALCTGVARAQDDGGGRSVLAYGAGNRALALGGAYAGLSDDASAPLWNPGGLGLARRRELQASYTGYYGLGIGEQYASMVVPSWRWGAVSATFRHFGVSDIEQRDERNVLLDDGLSDSQSEFGIGYGRALSDGLSAGAVVKFRQHSLAGFSGNGVGVDLGIILKPLRWIAPGHNVDDRLSLGIAVRNALEPQIRLDQETVADPLGVRVGAAVPFSLFEGRSALVVVDLEKTRDMGTRVHSGVEVSVHSLLSLRAGINSGEFATGMSTSWRGIDINYVYEGNDVGSLHRVGATIQFGPTVQESRDAAYAERERALQEKLAAAFEERQQARVQQLLQEANAARTQGDVERALNLLAVAQMLSPSDEAARALEAACLNDVAGGSESRGDYSGAAVTYARALELAPGDATAQAGYRRSREAGDRQAKRTSEIRKHYDDALDAFSRQKLTEARDGFGVVLKLAPDDREAAVMLERTNEAIDHRCGELIANAERMIDWGYLDESASSLAQVRELNPSAKGLERASSRLKSARAAAGATQTSSNTDSQTASAAGNGAVREAPLTEAQKREVEHLYEQGTAAMAKGDADAALRYLELVISIDPSHAASRDLLKREYLRRGMESFADGQLDQAISTWEKALRLDPADPRTAGYLSRARQQMTRTQQILGGRK